MIRNYEVKPETDAVSRELTVKRNAAIAALEKELAAEAAAEADDAARVEIAKREGVEIG